MALIVRKVPVSWSASPPHLRDPFSCPQTCPPLVLPFQAKHCGVQQLPSLTRQPHSLQSGSLGHSLSVAPGNLAKTCESLVIGRLVRRGWSQKAAIKNTSSQATRRGAIAMNATLEEQDLSDAFQRAGWKKVKQLTTEEHWLLSDAHKKNWHGQWIRYIAKPSETAGTSYTIQELKYGIRNIKWVDAGKTESFHMNHYFSEAFEPLRTAGPWINKVAESTPEGVIHAASEAATTLYLPDGAAVWASKVVDPNVKPLSLAAEMFLRPDNDTRVSVVPFYTGNAFSGVSLIREAARKPAEELELRPATGEPFWTYETELPTKRGDIAAELIGTETLITGRGLALLEREGKFGGSGGAQRGVSLSGDTDAFGPSLGAEEYEVVRLPENLSARYPKRLVEGQAFELSVALVTADGMGASQMKVIYGSDWKLKGAMYGTYFA